MAEAGVDRAVLVPPSWEGFRNDYCLAAAQRYPDRFRVMGRIPLDAPEGPDLVRHWLDQAGMAGLRATFSRADTTAGLTDGSADWLWDAAEKAGVPVAVYAVRAFDVLTAIAREHPSLPLVVDHLGIPTNARYEELDELVDGIVKLAALPNVAVKASCLPNFAPDTFPFRSLHTAVQRVVEAFTPQRVFWGSDATRLKCPYWQARAMFTDAMSFLSPGDLEWIMGRAIEQWLAW
jgi:predicted TIM-barrel fold metal-dependent hydrolase